MSVGFPSLPAIEADVDDPPVAALQQPRNHGLAEQERADHVDLEDPPHLVDIEVPAQVGAAGDPGIVDQDRQRPELALGLLDGGRDLVLRADVAHKWQPVELAGDGLGRRAIAVEHGDRAPAA